MSSFEKKRVLVADDNLEFRELLVDYLTLEGYEVGSAEDGQQALAIYLAGQFDLVLSDINMNGLDGISFARTLLQINPAAKVFLMSAADYVPEREIFKLGVKALIQKPFRFENLCRRISEILQN